MIQMSYLGLIRIFYFVNIDQLWVTVNHLLQKKKKETSVNSVEKCIYLLVKNKSLEINLIVCPFSRTVSIGSPLRSGTYLASGFSPLNGSALWSRH